MRREQLSARPGWREIVINQGLSFPDTPRPDGSVTPYWMDDVAYEFTIEQIEQLEAVTAQLWDMSLKTVEHVLRQGNLADFGLPASALDYLRWSWDTQQPTVYGRFDVAWDGIGQPKLLEFNADTPTGLIESSVCQWFWLNDQKPGHDQFNSLHERLVEVWRRIANKIPIGGIHFAYLDDLAEGEDWVTTAYMRDTATEAGNAASELYVTEIGYDTNGWFLDQHDAKITALFKLYPWEDLLREPFAGHLMETKDRIKWFEPAWKAILSNKAFLAAIWQLFPDHPLLLPAYLGDPRDLTHYAKKPLFGREGDMVTLHTPEGDVVNSSDSRYGPEGYVYQQYHPLPYFDGNHPVLGLWVVDHSPAGMGIRESDSLITDYFARFTPHYISDAAPPDARQTAEWIAEDYPAPGPGLGATSGSGQQAP